MSDLDRVTAPWSQDQVNSILAYQKVNGPVCCPEQHPDGLWHPMLATSVGWFCVQHEAFNGCGYHQDWAPRFMTDWSWRDGD